MSDRSVPAEGDDRDQKAELRNLTAIVLKFILSSTAGYPHPTSSLLLEPLPAEVDAYGYPTPGLPPTYQQKVMTAIRKPSWGQR